LKSTPEFYLLSYILSLPRVESKCNRAIREQLRLKYNRLSLKTNPIVLSMKSLNLLSKKSVKLLLPIDVSYKRSDLSRKTSRLLLPEVRADVIVMEVIMEAVVVAIMALAADLL
jgi:hypothetical protein